MSNPITELWGGPKDGTEVIDDGRMTYDVLITEGMGIDGYNPALAIGPNDSKPFYTRGTYTRHVRIRDGKAVYVWQEIRT